MAKAAIDEVGVLRFFETEPLDKATVLFNIVADKMQARLHGDHVGLPGNMPERRRAKIGRATGLQPPEAPAPATGADRKKGDFS